MSGLLPSPEIRFFRSFRFFDQSVLQNEPFPANSRHEFKFRNNQKYIDTCCYDKLWYFQIFWYTSWYFILPPGLRSLARPPHLNVVTVQHAATLYKNIPPQFLSLLSLQQFLVIEVSNNDSKGMWFSGSDARCFKSSAWFSRGHNFPYMCLPHFQDACIQVHIRKPIFEIVIFTYCHNASHVFTLYTCSPYVHFYITPSQCILRCFHVLRFTRLAILV